jgi:hypothetical protein
MEKRSTKTLFVETGDIDVILLARVPRFKILYEEVEVWIAFRSGTKQTRLLDVMSLYESLGPAMCRGLPMLPALSGCDTTSAFKTKGKRLWWKALKRNPEIIEALIV